MYLALTRVSQQELEQVLRRFSGDSSLVVDRVSDAVAIGAAQVI